jgi:riboflavin biosynthesis pyrimidine reductase
VILTRVHPAPAESLQLDAAGSRDRLLQLYRPPRAEWLRLNLVMSVSGSAAGADGTSESLTSTADRRILGVIRELSDVVLVGAASVRVEGYQLPRRSRLAVLTSSGDLSGHRLGDDAGRLIVVCPESAVESARASVGDAEFLIVAETDGRASMPDVVGALRGAGLASIVCEGGPHLATQLVAAGLADELCLTTSPRLTPVSLAVLGQRRFAESALTLSQLIVDESSALFARWAIAAQPASGR